MTIGFHKGRTFLVLAIAIVGLGFPPVLPKVAASGTTLFSDNFSEDPAIAGPVYSWKNPVGANNYMPPETISSYPAYQQYLYPSNTEYEPSGSGGCVGQGVGTGLWTLTATPVNNAQGSLSGKYYIAADEEIEVYNGETQFWQPTATLLPTPDPASGEVSVTVSGSNNAISLTVSLPPGNGHPAGTTLLKLRVFITTTEGAEVTSSDYFNETYSPTGVTFAVYSLTSASIGTHGVGAISQCIGFPPLPASPVVAPNSIFTVTSERHTADTPNSLLMGEGDDAYEKTDTRLVFKLSAIPFPSDNLLQFSMAYWLSGSNSSAGGTGVCSNNDFQRRSPQVIMLGDDLYYGCFTDGFGTWYWSDATGIGTHEGTYWLTLQTWHVITITLDISQAAISYYDLTIDGVEPSWVLGGATPMRGTPLYLKQSPYQPAFNWWRFAWWLQTSNGMTDLSRARLGNDGAYMYVDDISITLTPTTPTPVTMTVSYSAVGGGSPTAPVFHYVSNGMSKSLKLSTAPTAVSVDSGTGWSVTPDPLTGSTLSQRWYSTQPLTGTASATTIKFLFQDQYALIMKTNGLGSVTPTNGWYNAGQKVTIAATANPGHKFKSWTGKGIGSYTGTSASHTITMNAGITETATFT